MSAAIKAIKSASVPDETPGGTIFRYLFFKAFHLGTQDKILAFKNRFGNLQNFRLYGLVLFF